MENVLSYLEVVLKWIKNKKTRIYNTIYFY